MATRIGDHIRSNVVGYIALFCFAMGGTAWATHPGGANTISSGDIINGEVKNGDLAADSVASGKIQDQQVKNADLSIGASSSNTIADGGIQAVDVQNNTLTGAKVNESTLAGLWFLGGNPGTGVGDFLGTTDNQPLNLRVNNARALRLEPASNGINQSPNVIGGSADNSVTAGVHSATIGGGGREDPASAATANRVTDHRGTVAGGVDNQAGDGAGTTFDGGAASVGGGAGNTASGEAATVGGGGNNTAGGFEATVSGGGNNSAGGQTATVSGGAANDASGNVATVAGGGNNSAGAQAAAVGGGDSNAANELFATVGGGFSNNAGAESATVDGGSSNAANALQATVGGGFSNSAGGESATVGGGDSNTASGLHATVSGGLSNTADGVDATVAGGFDNTASGAGATVPGGTSSSALGDFSLAGGLLGQADHNGAFVWAGSNSPFEFASTAINQFSVRSTGGARFVSAIDGATGAPTAGVELAPGGGSWSSLSDAASKRAVEPVSGREVLRELASVPISTWGYRSQDEEIRHIGPMAQDFYRAFGVGEDRRHISSVDADGVALAAVKGLNSKLTTKVDRLERKLAALERRLRTAR